MATALNSFVIEPILNRWSNVSGTLRVTSAEPNACSNTMWFWRATSTLPLKIPRACERRIS